MSFNRVRPSGDTAEYQLPAPSAPGPDAAEPWDVQMGRGESIFGAFEMREFPVPERDANGQQPFSRRLWFRARPEWPADPLMAACALAFASDLGVTTAASVTEGLYPNAAVLSSLDHGLWLHRPTDVHEWHLLDLVSVSNSASRGVVRGSMHRIDGTLVGHAHARGLDPLGAATGSAGGRWPASVRSSDAAPSGVSATAASRADGHEGPLTSLAAAFFGRGEVDCAHTIVNRAVGKVPPDQMIAFGTPAHSSHDRR